jgi:hypothetical protein
MENEIVFEKGKLYTIEQIENEGLIIYKQLTSGNIVFKKGSITFWFYIKKNYINNTSYYEFLSYYSD